MLPPTRYENGSDYAQRQQRKRGQPGVIDDRQGLHLPVFVFDPHRNWAVKDQPKRAVKIAYAQNKGFGYDALAAVENRVRVYPLDIDPSHGWLSLHGLFWETAIHRAFSPARRCDDDIEHQQPE